MSNFSPDPLSIRSVIFDIDGTLLDSVELHIEAWKRTFERFGKEVSSEAVRKQIGKGSDDMLPVFFSQEELAQFRAELEKYRGDLYKREYLPKVKAFPRVRELFERIKYDHKQIALGSTSKSQEINIYKEIARIDDLVDCVACSDEVEQSKPHRDICAVALDKLGDIPPIALSLSAILFTMSRLQASLRCVRSGSYVAAGIARNYSWLVL